MAHKHRFCYPALHVFMYCSFRGTSVRHFYCCTEIQHNASTFDALGTHKTKSGSKKAHKNLVSTPSEHGTMQSTKDMPHHLPWWRHCVMTMEVPKMNPHVNDIFLHIQSADYTCLPTGIATAFTRDLAEDLFFCPFTQPSHRVAHNKAHLRSMCSGTMLLLKTTDGL